MNDFLIAVILTTIVSIFTILADFVASRFIIETSTNHSIEQILKSGLPKNEIYERSIEQIERCRASKTGLLVWGSDLATVAFSLDLAALGIWIHNSTFFPFFTKFNTNETSLEIPIWFIIIFFHAILLLMSIILKHKHGVTIDSLFPDDWEKFPSKTWFSQKGWMISANFTGFISLLSGFAIYINVL